LKVDHGQNATNLTALRRKIPRCGPTRASPARYNQSVPVQIIAMDLDGTLLNTSGHLPGPNVRAIEQAAARGIEILIVTGRRFTSARTIAAEIGCDVHLICSNGALIKSSAGDTQFRRLLPAATARAVLEGTAEFRSCAGVIFDRPRERQIYFERVDWNGPFVGPYLRRHRDQVAEVDPLTDCLDGEDPVEILYIDSCERITRALKALETLAAGHEFTLALTEYPNRDLSMLDVLASGVNKGAALAEWARLRGVPRENVMAIGDNWNDREMLEYAGLPIVMGNSIPELKALGWSVTGSNDDCGLAEAIHRHVLRDVSGRSEGGMS
jgi:Cof subfamily protein (haloacid dehalogenase superfamily)